MEKGKRKSIFTQNVAKSEVSEYMVQSIHLTETSAVNSEDSERYFLSANHRKMKGSPQPYSQTHRMKQKEKRYIEHES